MRDISEVTWFRSRDLDRRVLSDLKYYGTGSSILISRSKEINILFIDDLGCERDTPRIQDDYEDILDSRVSNEKVSVFSTNLGSDALNKKFGPRFLSRLKIFHWIKFDGEDRRG